MDITKCRGDNCPVKERCRRWTVFATPDYQSWFSKPPYKIKGKKLECDFYWGNKSDLILNNLYSILNSEEG